MTDVIYNTDNTDVAGWIYVEYDVDEATNTKSWKERSDTVRQYNAWLDRVVGAGNWAFLTGNIYAKGVYIKDPHAAAVFKLTFGL